MLFFRAQRRACFESLNVLDFHGVPPCHLWLEKGKPTWSSLTCPAYWSLAAWQSAWRLKTWRPWQFLKKPPCKRCRKMIRNLCAQKMLKKECSTFFLHLFFWGMVPAWSFSDRKSSHKRKAGEPRMIESGRAQKGSTESIGRSEITIRFSGQVVFL